MPPPTKYPGDDHSGCRTSHSEYLAGRRGRRRANDEPRLGRLRASQINACSACAGKARHADETDKRLLDEARAALMLPIATTGVFSRLNVTTRPVAGSWRPS